MRVNRTNLHIKFGVNSSSRFLQCGHTHTCRPPTHKVTDATDLPTHASDTTLPGGIGKLPTFSTESIHWQSTWQLQRCNIDTDLCSTTLNDVTTWNQKLSPSYYTEHYHVSWSYISLYCYTGCGQKNTPYKNLIIFKIS